jgi:uncharacterized DUF497 family protein
MKLPGIGWDENKNAINKAKHSGLSFDIAQYVFTDPQRIERRDESEGNTSGEERRQTLGMVDKVLMVVYTEIGETKKSYRRGWLERPKKELLWLLSNRRQRLGEKFLEK